MVSGTTTAQRWSGCSARSLCTSARAVFTRPPCDVDELELAAVAGPERGAEVAVLGPDVHRPHPVGVEVVDVAHRPVEPVVDPGHQHDRAEAVAAWRWRASGSGSSSFVATWS